MNCSCESCSSAPEPTYTEAHRHACEVRYVAAMTHERRLAYLTGERSVASIRGREACQRIIESLKEIANGKAT